MIIWKHLMYLLVFFAVAVTALHYVNWGRELPVSRPDTRSYQDVARQIKAGIWPDTSLRLPVYPLYLYVFGITPGRTIIYVNVFLYAVSAVLLYWILNRLFPMQWINMAAILFMFADYGIVNYLNVLLTESITPALLIFSLWSTVYVATHQGVLRRQSFLIILFIIGDVLLMYCKPQYILLPLLMKTFLLLYRNNPDKRQTIRVTDPVFVGICIDVVLVIFILGYNSTVNGRFQLSDIGTMNIMGKEIRAGMLDNVPVHVRQTEKVQQVFLAYETSGRARDPYMVLRELTISLAPRVENVFTYVSATNSVLLSTPKGAETYILSALTTIPAAATELPEYALRPRSELLHSSVFVFLKSIYKTADRLGLWGVGIAVCFYFVLLRISVTSSLVWGLCLMPVVYLLLVNSFFNYEEFFRIRASIVPLMYFFELSPILCMFSVIHDNREKHIHQV